MGRLLSFLFVIFFCAAANALVHDPRAIDADPASADSPIAPRLEGLGDYSMKVTTSNPDSQYFFDQGLRLTYGFNHSEALRSFKEAARLDPENAMAYWGWALALGPNINLGMQAAVNPQAYGAIQKAISLKDKVSEKERAFIDALSTRYVREAPEDRSQLDYDYAASMHKLTENYPEDLEALTLYGAALMNLSPWDYWQGDGRPKVNTPKIMAAFEKVLSLDPAHPGAIHYYIHTVEVAHPHLAESYADTLLGLMPGAGHMVHMPSHIYMRVGRYMDSYDANRRASDADAAYIAQCNAQGIYPLNYYPHNLHFMVWSAMFLGQSDTALAGAREVESKIPMKLVPIFRSLEIFLSQPMYVMVRFGMWDKLLAEPMPNKDFGLMTGVWYYGQGTAQSNTGDLAAAKATLAKLNAHREGLPTDYGIGFSTAPALLHIAELLLSADIDAKEKNYDAAIASLSRAARLEDSLLYSEPPDWYFPTRHVLGAVLLEAGYANEAAAVYWQDLRKHPENGYALLGLSQAMQAQGDIRSVEMAERFEKAWSDADVELTNSRF